MVTLVRLCALTTLSGSRVTLLKHFRSHDQSRKTKGERIDTRVRIIRRMSIGPDNIKARVDVRDREAMQSGMRESQRCEVIIMGDL